MKGVNVTVLTGEIKEFEENQYGYTILLDTGMKNPIPLKIAKTSLVLMERARKYVRKNIAVTIIGSLRSSISQASNRYFLSLYIDRLILANNKDDFNNSDNKGNNTTDGIDFVL